MDIEKIKFLVALTQKTKNWLGKDAYKVPNGQCATDLNYAAKLWFEYLKDK